MRGWILAYEGTEPHNSPALGFRFPARPVFAPAFFRRQHPLTAKLISENLSVLIFGEHEHLEALTLPGDRVSVPGQGKIPNLTKLPELVEVFAGTLLLLESHPVGKILIRCPEYPTIGVHTLP
jgi:hypothetical protein